MFLKFIPSAAAVTVGQSRPSDNVLHKIQVFREMVSPTPPESVSFVTDFAT